MLGLFRAVLHQGYSQTVNNGGTIGPVLIGQDSPMQATKEFCSQEGVLFLANKQRKKPQ